MTDLNNVYDFGDWTVNHAGGSAAITQWAENGQTKLQFPSNHDMGRWQAKSAAYLSMLGRLGDTVDFLALPSSVQTLEMARQVGAIASSDPSGFEACGSPGEVPNVPALGHRYGIYMDGIVVDPKDQQFDGGIVDYNDRGAKTNVWLNVVLHAPDQLRQRVAWALSQVVVIAENGSGKARENEVYHTYYDIFVRHAFGNYRDILREASWSPMMAMYLSYRRNRAWGFVSGVHSNAHARHTHGAHGFSGSGELLRHPSRTQPRTSHLVEPDDGRLVPSRMRTTRERSCSYSRSGWSCSMPMARPFSTRTASRLPRTTTTISWTFRGSGLASMSSQNVLTSRTAAARTTWTRCRSSPRGEVRPQ